MKKVFCAALAASLLAGCATEDAAPAPEPVSAAPVAAAEPAPPPYVPKVNTIATAQPAAKVSHVAYREVVLDGFLSQCAAAMDVRRSKTNDGFERVQVLVKNTTEAPVRVRYRFDWQDAAGVVIDDPDAGGWEKATLVPGDEGTFTSIAPRKDCKDFRLKMKVVQ